MRPRHPLPQRRRPRRREHARRRRARREQVQACVNGYGERCGNANILSVIANLKLKMGIDVVSDEQLARLTEVSHYTQELANLAPNPQQPYVGASAFAHKAGLHVAGDHRRRPARTSTSTRARRQRSAHARVRAGGQRNIIEKLGAGHRVRADRRDRRPQLLERVKDHGVARLPVRGRRGLVRAARPPHRPPATARRSSSRTSSIVERRRALPSRAARRPRRQRDAGGGDGRRSRRRRDAARQTAAEATAPSRARRRRAQGAR